MNKSIKSIQNIRKNCNQFYLPSKLFTRTLKSQSKDNSGKNKRVKELVKE